MGVLCLVGFLAVLYAAAWGIGLSPDSVAYISGARSLAAGEGFSSPSWDGAPELITHHAPMYSAVLAFGGMVGVDPLLLVPWLNAILFAVNIGLAGYFVGSDEKTRGSRAWFFPLMCAWLILVSKTILEIHSMAWTEPLFIASALGSVIFLRRFIEHQKTRDLIVAGMLTAFASLTRYVGIVLILTGLVTIQFFSQSNRNQKIKSALVYTLVSVLPLMVWLMRNWVLAGSATNRTIAFHPPGLDQLLVGLTTVSSWLLIPESASSILKVVLIALVVGIVVYLSIKWSRFQNIGLPITFKILTLFLIFYLGFLIFSISLLDANTPLDGRILSPVWVAGICIIFSCLGWAYHNSSSHVVRIAISIGCIFLAIAYLPRGLEFIRGAHSEGLGLSNRIWSNSETIHLAQELPAGIPIYSNLPEAVYIHAQHTALRLSSRVSSVTQTENAEYTAEMDQIRNDMHNHNGVIVYFDALSRSNYPSKSELINELDPLSIKQASDGVILSLNPR